MAPRRGQKRKRGTIAANSGRSEGGDVSPPPPDRETWPGWVEMESEPAFFNTMMREMGVRGVKIHEVLSLDEEMMFYLPQPIHALIFLFRYRETEEATQDKGTACPEHIWFANQIPDFACASVALLNIINNIKSLEMGKELHDFRDFTQDMDPMSRGDAIDSFDFARRIHNSFARENDILNADMFMKQKVDKTKRRQALAKGRETRKANEAARTPLKEKPANVDCSATRKSQRSIQQTEKKQDPNADATSTASSPLSDPPDSDHEYATPSKSKTSKPEANIGVRRSTRAPKPRKDTFAASAAAAAEEDDETGFHFIAYVPIGGHVWKLDGLDSFPHDMGPFDDAEHGGYWINVVRPALQTRMAMYEGADIEFNLMAVVHDALTKDRADLLENVRELQAVDRKLDRTFEDWRALDGAETRKNVLTGTSTELGISQADIDTVTLPAATAEAIEAESDLLKLVERRKQIACGQGPLRAAVRDALESAKADEEKARHRRHDYGSFVKSWLGTLGDNELLSQLIEDI